jgi:hypothetical protein
MPRGVGSSTSNCTCIPACLHLETLHPKKLNLLSRLSPLPLHLHLLPLNSMEGRCQCGLIRFTTPLSAPLKIYICHCTECRHQSSSSYGITCIFPSFAIAAPYSGAIGTYARPNSQGETRGSFCTKCGSRLVHRSFSAEGTEVKDLSVKGGCLVALNREMMSQAVHIWTKEAVVDIPAGVEQWEEEPLEGSFT